MKLDNPYSLLYYKLKEKIKDYESFGPKYFPTLVYFLDKKFMYEVNLLISEIIAYKKFNFINIAELLDKNDTISQFIVFLIQRFKRKIEDHEYT